MSYPGAPPPPGGFPNQPPGIELCDEIACNLLSVEYGSYKNSHFQVFRSMDVNFCSSLLKK